MKFMATWRVQRENWLPLSKRWASMSPQERANAGEGVKLVGRWGDPAARTGVAIFESNEVVAVQRYIGQWNPYYLDVTLVPVLDDEESAALARQIVADNNA